MTTRVTIRTTTDARDYLAARGLNPTIEGEYVIESAACTRCGGRGYGGWYPDGGICYDCRGANTVGRTRRIGLVAYARAARRRETAAARKAAVRREAATRREEALLAGQRRWNEANGYGAVTFAERDAAKAAAEAEAKAAAEANGTASTHVGTLGERLELTGTVEAVRTFERDAWGYGGGVETCYVYTIRVGNDALVTFGRNLNIDVGDTITFRGTVKDHGEYRGERQTTVNRVNIRKVEKPVAAAPAEDPHVTILNAVAERLLGEPEAFTYAPNIDENLKNHARILNNMAARLVG